MKKIIFLTLLAAFILRFYHLGNLPPGLHRDEASLGYNAYSILNTGRDEYGRLLPLGVESFGDWKLPGYILGTIPFVAVMGLNEFSTRSLSALAGCLSIVVIFMLVKKIFVQEKFQNFLAVTAAVFFAFLPWNIFFSRAAYEANLALCFLLVGYYFFLKRQENLKYLFLTGLFWGLNFLTYHASHIFIPFFFGSLILIDLYHFGINKLTKWLILIFSLLMVLNILTFVLSGDKTKISGIGIFSDTVRINHNYEIPRVESQMILGKLTPLFYNRGQYLISTFVVNYLSFFSPQFLISEGGTNIQHNLPGRGNLSYLDYLLMLLGIVYLLTNLKSYQKYFFPWLLVVPIAAAITRDAPHYTRSIPGAGIIPILSALGLLAIIKKLQSFKLPIDKIVAGLVMLLYFSLFLQFLSEYFIRFPKTGAKIWNGGMRLISSTIHKNESQYDQIIYGDSQSSPYIFLLFYDAYAPARYQLITERYPATSEGFVHVKHYDKFYFPDEINWNAVFKIKGDNLSNKILLVDKINKLPFDWKDRIEEWQKNNPSVSILKVINYSDGTPDTIIVSVRVPSDFDWKKLISTQSPEIFL